MTADTVARETLAFLAMSFIVAMFITLPAKRLGSITLLQKYRNCNEIGNVSVVSCIEIESASMKVGMMMSETFHQEDKDEITRQSIDPSPTGASGGIGEATAKKFAAEGAIVVLADVREEALVQQLASLIAENRRNGAGVSG